MPNSLLVLLFYSLSFLFFSITGLAQPKIDFDKDTENYPSSNTEHSFCYSDSSNNEIQGTNVDEKVRLASVSKLVTSLWAISVYGPMYRFQTIFYYDSTKKSLHIEGSRDPFMGRRRMQMIISELNNRGIFELDTITFSKNFTFYPDIEESWAHSTTIAAEGPISKNQITEDLMAFFNTNKWSTNAWKFYKGNSSDAAEWGVPMRSQISMSTKQVEFASTTPDLKNAIAYVSSSPPLYRYLKEMNKYSLNYPADEIFRGLGGKKHFVNFWQNYLKFDINKIQMTTGSGLPYFDGDTRLDNWITCRATLEVVGALEAAIQKRSADQGVSLKLSDVILVGGVDPGTLGATYRSENIRGSVLAKTGTLNTAVTLAGLLETKKGEVYFGIFFQPPSSAYINSLRRLRDKWVVNLIRGFGGSAPESYKPRSFFSMDKNALLTTPNNHNTTNRTVVP